MNWNPTHSMMPWSFHPAPSVGLCWLSCGSRGIVVFPLHKSQTKDNALLTPRTSCSIQKGNILQHWWKGKLSTWYVKQINDECFQSVTNTLWVSQIFEQGPDFLAPRQHLKCWQHVSWRLSFQWHLVISDDRINGVMTWLKALTLCYLMKLHLCMALTCIQKK